MALSWWTSPGSSFFRGRCRRLCWRMWIGGGVGGEYIVPHSLDVSSQFGQTFLRGAVVAARSFPAVAHEPGSAEHPKMLGNARMPDPCDAGELTYRVRSGAQALEQRPPGRIGERNHYRSIGHVLYRHPCMDKSITISLEGASCPPKITEPVLTENGHEVRTRERWPRRPRTGAARASPSGIADSGPNRMQSHLQRRRVWLRPGVAPRSADSRHQSNRQYDRLQGRCEQCNLSGIRSPTAHTSPPPTH